MFGILNKIFGKKENKVEQNIENKNEHNVELDIDALKEFIKIILINYDEKVFKYCKKYLDDEKSDESIMNVLYLLSGVAIDGYENYEEVCDIATFEEDKHYLISIDGGAWDLEDFFYYIDDMIETRKLNIVYDKEKFSDDDYVYTWLEELSDQLRDYYIVNFQEISEDYHFTIVNKKESDTLITLYEKISSCVPNTNCKAYIINK